MLRALAAAALTASLLAPPAVRPVLGQLHALLSSLGSAPAPKEGCGMDPFGRCNALAPQPGPDTEAGCGMDPFGRCNALAPQPGPDTEAGCGADPNGSPRCS